MTDAPCLDCKHKRKANPANGCSKCGNTMCDKCWKKAGNSLMWSYGIIFGWWAMFFSKNKKRYKCKACRRGDDIAAMIGGVIVIGALLGLGWYVTNVI